MKKIISLMFALLLLSIGITVSAASSGKIGDNITYNITDGVLTLTGTGEMAEYDYHTDHIAPWKNEAGSIEKIVVGEGITTIADGAFRSDERDGIDYSSLTEIALPSTLTSSNFNSFIGNRNITKLYLSDIASWCNVDMVNWASHPFGSSLVSNELYLNGKLVTNLIIPDGVTEIKDCVFLGIYSIETVTIPTSVTTIGEESFYHSGITDVYYEGTEEEWNANVTLTGGESNALYGKTMHFGASTPAEFTAVTSSPNSDTPETTDVMMTTDAIEDMSAYNYFVVEDSTGKRGVKLSDILTTKVTGAVEYGVLIEAVPNTVVGSLSAMFTYIAQ